MPPTPPFRGGSGPRVARVWPVRPLVLAALLLGPLAGCGTTSGTPDAPTAPASTSALGGLTSRPVPAPTTGMDSARASAWPLGSARARRAGADPGPPGPLRRGAGARTRWCAAPATSTVWSGRSASLSRSPSGTVEFDARLEDGVVATQNLVRRLEAEGWTTVEGTGPPTAPRSGADRVRRAPACPTGLSPRTLWGRRRTWSPPSPTSPARWRSGAW